MDCQMYGWTASFASPQVVLMVVDSNRLNRERHGQ